MHSRILYGAFFLLASLSPACLFDSDSGPAVAQPTPTPQPVRTPAATYEVDRLVFEDNFSDSSPWTEVTDLTCYNEGACEWEPTHTTRTPGFTEFVPDASGPLYWLMSYCQVDAESSTWSSVFGEKSKEEVSREIPNISPSFDLGAMSRIVIYMTYLDYDRGTIEVNFKINGKTVEIRFKKNSTEDTAVSIGATDEEYGDVKYGGIKISFDIIDGEETQIVDIVGKAAAAIPHSFKISASDSGEPDSLRISGQSQCYEQGGVTKADNLSAMFNGIKIYQLKLVE